jgi:hypothetical protein
MLIYSQLQKCFSLILKKENPFLSANTYTIPYIQGIA